MTATRPYRETEGSASSLSQRAPLVPGIFFAAIAVLYLLQIGSPLRLNIDVMTYLSVAASALDGVGFVDRGAPSQFPPGYPTLIGLLYLTGLPVPPLLVGLNVLFVALGATITFGLAREAFGYSRDVSLVATCGLLLSFVVVKHVTLPMAEAAFLATSLAALYSLSLALRDTQRTPIWLVVALVLAAGSIMLRTIGIALVPAVLFVLVILIRARLRGKLSRALQMSLATSIAFVVGLPVAYLALTSKYFSDFLGIMQRFEPLRVYRITLEWKLLEWGELFLNVPGSQLPSGISSLLLVIGVAGVGLVAVGFWRRRKAFGPAEAYFLTYFVILFVWPGFDARFWLPVVPLIALYSITAVRGLWHYRGVRIVSAAYMAVFLITGIVALGYSTSISLSGSQFAHRYGDGSLTATYLLVYEGETGEGDVNERALRVLRRFEPDIHPVALP